VLNSKTQRDMSSENKNNRRERNCNDSQAMVTLSVDAVHWRVTVTVFLLNFLVSVSSSEGLLPFSVSRVCSHLRENGFKAMFDCFSGKGSMVNINTSV